MKLAFKLAIASWLLITNALAGDIALEVQQGPSDNGSFAEIGISWQTSQLPLIGFNDQELEKSGDIRHSIDLNLQGRFQYKHFFAEMIQASFSDLTVGFNIKDTPDYNLDLIASTSFSSIERNRFAGYETIKTRDEDISVGFRSSFYNEDESVFQYELVADASDAHGGIMVAANYGKQYQYRNWNLHSLVGVRYFSDKVVDHYFGITEEESTQALPTYRAKSGFMPTVLLGATLPVSENWVFRTDIEYSYLPDSVSESPLADGHDLFIAQAGFHRILYPR